MKGKLIAGALAGATLATGAIAPTLSNATNANKNVPKTNDVLLAKPVTNVSGQEAVVINGNNNLVLLNQANGTSINSYLSTGQMLTLMNKDGNFYQVKVQETGAVGYISTSNMQIIQSGVNSPFVQKISDGSIINVSTAVHLRAQPDMQAGILKNLKEGSNVEILGTQGQWVKVNVGGTIGYVYQTYVSNGTTSNSTNNTTTNSQNTTGQTVTSNKVNTATNATNNSGATATKPSTSNTTTKPSTTVNPGTSTSVNPTYLNDTAYLKAGTNVTLYANQPSTVEWQPKVLKTFNNEKINVTVLSFANNMYKVKLSDGAIGYIAPNNVVFSGQGAKSEYLNKLN
ncbi:MAG: SH3 domain-containing protein, partial [Sarcina sp.]